MATIRLDVRNVSTPVGATVSLSIIGDYVMRASQDVIEDDGADIRMMRDERMSLASCRRHAPPIHYLSRLGAARMPQAEIENENHGSSRASLSKLCHH